MQRIGNSTKQVKTKQNYSCLSIEEVSSQENVFVENVQKYAYIIRSNGTPC
jgi:hypothetical protein